MTNLIRARLYRYTHSIWNYLILLISAVLLGYLQMRGEKDIEAWLMGRCVELEYGYLTSPINGELFIGVAVEIAILIVLNAGREFRDRTIHNQIATGATKVQVYLAEIVTGLILSGVIWFLSLLPLQIVYTEFFTSIPRADAAMWVLLLLLFCCLISVITVTICYLVCRSAITAALVFLMIYLCNVSTLIHYEYFKNDLPKFTRRYFVGRGADGMSEVQETFQANQYYTEGMQHFLIEMEHFINPLSSYVTLYTVYYVYDDWMDDCLKFPEEERQRAVNSQKLLYKDALAAAIMCIIVTGAGVVLFRRRNLK